MFRLLSEQLAWWPVRFNAVDADGKVITHEIELQFLILDEDAMTGFADAVVAEGQSGDTKTPESLRMARALARVVKDWRGVGAANGEALPFNEENFAHLLRMPNVASAVAPAYAACRAAEPETREGN